MADGPAWFKSSCLRSKRVRLAAGERPAIQRRRRRKMSQLITLKRFASTAQNATQRRACAVTLFRRFGLVGFRV